MLFRRTTGIEINNVVQISKLSCAHEFYRGFIEAKSFSDYKAVAVKVACVCTPV